MTYEQFEAQVYAHINSTWKEADAVLIGEYFAHDSTAGSSLEVSISTETEIEATLGTIGDTETRLSVLSGTINLLLSLASDVGRTEALRVIGLARQLLHYKSFTAGGQCYAAIKKDYGSQDGKLIKLITIPFTAEIAE